MIRGAGSPSSGLPVGALTGAKAATRYAGATASGSPTTGAFLVGDFVIDQTGIIWVCTTAGSPGTWAEIGAGNAFGITSMTVIAQGTTTYTVPAGTRAILIECVAAGGGGGGCSTSAASGASGGGGGGGGYSSFFKLAPKLTAFTVAVGAGGAAGANTGGTGGTGNDTSFDTGPSLCVAKGGLGGVGETAGTALATVAGGAGGAASGGTGDVKLDGPAGAYGVRLSGLLGGSGAGGNGAGAMGGGGGVGLTAGGQGTGGGLYGGGGAGGLVLNNSAAVTGGAGGNGAILVTEFA